MARRRREINDTPPVPYDASPARVTVRGDRWRLRKENGRLLYVNDAGDVMEIPPPGPSNKIILGPNIRLFSPDADLEGDQ